MCFTNEELLSEASQWTGAHLERSARRKWSLKGLTGIAIQAAVQGSPLCNWWAWLQTATKGEKLSYTGTLGIFQPLLEQRKLLWKVFITNSWMIIKQNHKNNWCIYGKDPLSPHSPSEGPVLTTTKQQRYRQNNESETSAVRTQPRCFPNSSFLLPYALTDPGTACTPNGTRDLQKQ